MSKHRIVIYEQDHLTRTLLQEWLGEAGYEVRIGTPNEAQCEPPADLVVVSVYLPKCAGPASVRDIQAAHPDTPLIAISGHFRPGLAPAGAAAHALKVRQVLAKPLVRSEVLRAVSAIMAD
jgi:DNA-binding NtrC family response regulator